MCELLPSLLRELTPASYRNLRWTELIFKLFRKFTAISLLLIRRWTAHAEATNVIVMFYILLCFNEFSCVILVTVLKGASWIRKHFHGWFCDHAEIECWVINDWMSNGYGLCRFYLSSSRDKHYVCLWRIRFFYFILISNIHYILVIYLCHLCNFYYVLC